MTKKKTTSKYRVARRKASPKPKAKTPSAAAAPRTTGNTTLHELFTVVAPPRQETTGVHLVVCGPTQHLLLVQGPETQHLTRLVLDFLESVHERAALVAARDA